MRESNSEALRWWRQAQSDLVFLPKVREVGKFDTCCFLAQQTVEKALKAYLFHMGEELIFTHSIFRLCEMAAKYDQQFSILRDEIKQLDFYYVEARYPNAIEDVIPADFYTDMDAQNAIEMAEKAIEKIRPILDQGSEG